MGLAPGTRVGPYEIVHLLGAGGMGEVYRAHDAKLVRDVAVKILPTTTLPNADQLARFHREARLLATLSHPHIAAIYGLEEFGQTPAIVLELVEGPTLADQLLRGPLPVRDALKIGRQIAEALEAAHQKGIVHRDLKPANVKIAPGGIVKVLDFGLAKALESGASGDFDRSAETATGVVMGTAAYRVPSRRAVNSATSGPTSGPLAACCSSCSRGRQPSAGRRCRTPLPR
jgi:eukaryotic-like serine/threonine-protein kinase